MAIRLKRQYRRRRPMRKRRTFTRRGTRITGMVQAVKNNLVYIKRTVELSQWNMSTSGVWNGRAFSFKLSDIPSYTSFQNLFEQYKINAVKLTFFPAYSGDNDYNSALGSLASGGLYTGTPRVWTIVDKDGSPSVTTQAQMMNSSTGRQIKYPNRPFSIYVNKPCVQYEVGTSLGFAGSSPKSSPWLDCDNYGVIHEGCGVGGTYNGTVSGWAYYVYATFYMQFKIVK